MKLALSALFVGQIPACMEYVTETTTAKSLAVLSHTGYVDVAGSYQKRLDHVVSGDNAVVTTVEHNATQSKLLGLCCCRTNLQRAKISTKVLIY